MEKLYDENKTSQLDDENENSQLDDENEELVDFVINDQDIDESEFESELSNEDEVELIDIENLSSQYTGKDPVKNYLVMIGNIPLLSKEEENELFYKYKPAQKAKEKLAQFENYEIELSIAEEEKLHQIINDLDPIRERIINANLRLVVSIAKKYQSKNLSFLDFIQEGSLGLMVAVDKFDPDKGYKFSTYATWWIRQKIVRTIGDQSRTIRLPIHMVERCNKFLAAQRKLLSELHREPTSAEIAEEMKLPVNKVEELALYLMEPASLENKIGEDEDSVLGDFIEDKNILSPEEITYKDKAKSELYKILSSVLSERELFVLTKRFGLYGGQPHTLEQVGDLLNVTRERVRQIEAKAIMKLKRHIDGKHLRGVLDVNYME